ncbi:MAG: flagellin [Planctomycetota bacterium]
MSVRLQNSAAVSPLLRALEHAHRDGARSMRRLATGLRIDTAADDASGLAISERLRARIRSFDQARRNAADGVSLTQVADGALGEMGDLLGRMRELAVQAGNGTVSRTDLRLIDVEFAALRDEVLRIGEHTQYDGRPLLSGAAQRIQLQVGVGVTAEVDTIAIDTGDHLGRRLQLGGLRMPDAERARRAVHRIDHATEVVLALRGSYGAVQQRLGETIRTLSGQFEAASAAESRIRDADLATETAALTRSRILANAAIAMLAQARVGPGEAVPLLSS